MARHYQLSEAVGLYDRLGPGHTIIANTSSDSIIANRFDYPIFSVRENSVYMVDEPIVWFVDESFHGQIVELFKDVTTKRLSDEPNKSYTVKVGTHTICYTKLEHIADQISRAVEGSHVVSRTRCVMM
jgi:hypothetical protein